MDKSQGLVKPDTALIGQRNTCIGGVKTLLLELGQQLLVKRPANA